VGGGQRRLLKRNKTGGNLERENPYENRKQEVNLLRGWGHGILKISGEQARDGWDGYRPRIARKKIK
jgi:hypothetical protein